MDSRQFLVWYEGRKSAEDFDNMRVLETYCHNDVTVLRKACRWFRRQVMHIGYIEVFPE